MKPVGAPTICENWMCSAEATLFVKLHTRSEPLFSGDGHPVCSIHLKQTLFTLVDHLVLDEDATGITITLS